MDYKELSRVIRELSEIYGLADEVASQIMLAASTSITDLLSRAEAAEARAEKAERERDAAVADLRLVSDCRTCGNVSPWCIENPDKCKGWEWRGRKEE